MAKSLQVRKWRPTASEERSLPLYVPVWVHEGAALERFVLVRGLEHLRDEGQVANLSLDALYYQLTEGGDIRRLSEPMKPLRCEPLPLLNQNYLNRLEEAAEKGTPEGGRFGLFVPACTFSPSHTVLVCRLPVPYSDPAPSRAEPRPLSARELVESLHCELSPTGFHRLGATFCPAQWHGPMPQLALCQYCHSLFGDESAERF